MVKLSLTSKFTQLDSGEYKNSLENRKLLADNDKFDKWLAILASVGGLAGVLAWVTC